MFITRLDKESETDTNQNSGIHIMRLEKDTTTDMNNRCNVQKKTSEEDPGTLETLFTPESNRNHLSPGRSSLKSGVLSSVELSYMGWSAEAPVSELLCFCCQKRKENRSTFVRDTVKLEENWEELSSGKEQKWFGLFLDLILVSVIIQFAFEIKLHFRGFYILPTTLSFYEETTLYSPSKTYDSQHNIDCKMLKMWDTSEYVVTDYGLECVKMGSEVWLYESLLFFFVFFVIWLELSCTLGKFINLPGFIDDLLYLVSVLAIIGMAILFEPHKHMMDERDKFTVILSLFFSSLLLLNLLYYNQIPISRNYAWRRIWTFAAATVMNSIGGICEYWVNFTTIFLSCSLVFYVTLTGFIAQDQKDLTIEYFVERLGLLIMITTGESILALVIGDTEMAGAYSQTFQDHSIIVGSFSMMYLIKDLYFSSDVPIRLHALRKTVFPGAPAWVLLHFPLCYSLLLLGVGILLIFLDTDDYHYKNMIVWPLSSTLLFIDLLHLTHMHYRFSVYLIILRVIDIALIPCGLLLFWRNLNALLAWCVAITFLHLFKDKYLARWETNTTIIKLIYGTELEYEKKSSDESWDEWRTTGFMGPKIELWPPLLFLDVWKGNPKKGSERAIAMGGYKNLHPNEHIRHESSTRNWLMEFAELIFVGMIYKFADQIKYTLKYDDDYSSHVVIIESCVFFAVFFSIWMELVAEFARFKNMPGPVDDFARFVYLLGIVLMAVQCENNQYLSDNMNGFMSSYVISLCPIFCLHLCYLKYKVYDAVRYCQWRILCYGMVICSTMVCIVVSYFYKAYWLHMSMLAMNAFILLFYSLNSFRVIESDSVWAVEHKKNLEKAESMNLELDEPIEDHFLERFGLLVMITLGESVIALVVGSSQWEHEFDTLILVNVAFFMIVVIKHQYFAYNVTIQEGHALRKAQFPGSVAFCTIHLVLSLFLLWLGASWKLVLYLWDGNTLGKFYRLFMGSSVVGVMLCLIFCRFTHRKYTIKPLSFLRLIPVFSVVAICNHYDNPVYFSAGNLGCMVCLFIMDYRFYNKEYELANYRQSLGRSYRF